MDNFLCPDQDRVALQRLLLFDMTAMEWKYGYDAGAAEYERAPALQQWYGNG
jgi:hypothetical protein